MGRLKKEEDKEQGSEEATGHVDFYMKQTGTLDNACGIIACMHAALNSPVAIADDSILGKYWSANKTTTPAERCTNLENDNEFKQQHSGFAAQGQSAGISSGQDNVKHHFVAFVVKDGKLIELDGTKKGPHIIGDSDDVLRGSIKEIQRRLADGEISES